MNGSKKDLFKYFSGKSMGLLQGLWWQKTHKILRCSMSSPWSSLLRMAFCSPKTSKTRWKAWSKEDLLLVEDNDVRGHLNKTEILRSVGPDGMHWQVLRELAHVIVTSLPVIFERSWWLGEVSKYWKRTNVTVVFKKSKKEDQKSYRSIIFNLVVGCW